MASAQTEISRGASSALSPADPIRAGDATAFEHAFRRISGSLHRFAYRLSGSYSAANDAVQEAFAEAWRLDRAWDSEAALRAFLYCVTRTRTLMRRRHARVIRRQACHAEHALYPNGDVTPAANTEVERNELCDAVQAAVDALPAKTRNVILMSRFSGLTYREIAQTLGLSVKTVEWHMDRAFTLLRGPLARHWPLAAVLFATLYGMGHPG